MRPNWLINILWHRSLLLLLPSSLTCSMFLLFEQIFMVISHLFGFLHRAHNKYSIVQHTPLCKKEGMGKTGYPLFLLAFYSNFKHHNYVAKKQCQKRHKILQLTLKKWRFVMLTPKHLSLHALEHEWSMIYLEHSSLSPKKLVQINITSCNIYHWPFHTFANPDFQKWLS